MSKKTTVRIGPRPAAKATGLDPSGAEVVLLHVGRKHGELPARDLTGSDLNQLAYQRALRQDPARRPPDFADAGTLGVIAAELVAGGFYSYVPRETTADPEPTTPDEPATPAEAPEA